MAAAEDLRAKKYKSDRNKLRNVVAIIDSESSRCARRRVFKSLPAMASSEEVQSVKQARKIRQQELVAEVKRLATERDGAESSTIEDVTLQNNGDPLAAGPVVAGRFLSVRRRIGRKSRMVQRHSSD